MTEAPAPFDRALLGQRRLRAHAKAEPGADFLLQNVAEDLVDRLSLVQRRFAVGVDLAGYSGQLASRLAAGAKWIAFCASSATRSCSDMAVRSSWRTRRCCRWRTRASIS